MDAVDAGPVPTALVADTVNVYAVPFVNPLTVALVAGAGAADNGKNIIPFDGESVVYDRDGRLVAIGKAFEEDLLVVDLDASLPAVELPAADREREMYDALVMSLSDYMRKQGFARVIVPVSGGIDSALALAIAVDAIGAANVSAFNSRKPNSRKKSQSPRR